VSGDERPGAWAQLESVYRDLRYASRHIRRYPVAALVAVFSLAAGIGSATVALVARNALFRNPPPLYTEPSQLSRVTVHATDQRAALVPAPLFQWWATADDPAVAVAASMGGRSVEIRAGERLATISTQQVTPNLFALLGVAPALGRGFAAADDVADASAIVLSYDVWQSAR
jgi:hypothetical protein